MSVLLALALQVAPGVLVNGRPPADPSTQSQINQLMTAQAQSVEAVLDATGNYTWTFPVPYMTRPRVAYFPQNPDTTGKPIVCNYQTLTPTSITFHCDKSPGTLSALLAPLFSPTGAAGATVQLIARGTMVTPTITP